MVAHLQVKAARLAEMVGPLKPDDIVLDIGSNDGTLLGFYPEKVTRVGMDPTAKQFREYYKHGIQVAEEFFSGQAFQQIFGGRKAKIITSIAMFYDLEEPMRFVEDVESILADDGIWHFEQSYLPSMVAANAYDTICHEHLEYYCLKQIRWMMDAAKLKIIDVELNHINGGSFAVTVARKNSHRSSRRSTESLLGREEFSYRKTVRTISERESLSIARSSCHPGELPNSGLRTFGYGASTKGNVILQFCSLEPVNFPAWPT